jgi:hypothetical protein
MRRALFLREFRSALVPNLVTVGAILATLVVLEWFFGRRLGKAEDVRDFIDVALLAGLVVSGFISGERCFPSELKESRMLFLSSLPIPRTWAWLMIVSARLLAGLASLALVITLRRPLPALQDSGNLLRLDVGLVAVLPVFAYFLFFSAGSLFALLFRRTLFSYAVGLLVLGFLLIETVFSCSYITVSPTTLAGLANVPDPNPQPFILVFLVLFSLASLLLSLRFFANGEIADFKRRIRNQAIFAVTAVAYLSVVLFFASNTKFASIGSTSKLAIFWREALTCGVSSEGRYLFIFESLDHRPFLIRVNIVDTHTGRVAGQSIYGGSKWGFWSDHGDVLNLLALNNSPLNRWGYLIPGTLDWIRLSPDARELSKLQLKGIEEAQILSGGRALVVLREDSQARVLLLDGTSGRSSEIIRASVDGKIKVVVQEDGLAALVYFDNVVLKRRAWAIDSAVHEVQIPRSTLKTFYVQFGQVFGSAAAFQADLRKRFGVPFSPEGLPMPGRFLLPGQAWISTAGTDLRGVYFKEEAGGLWARSMASEGHWEKLSYHFPSLLQLAQVYSENPERLLANLVDFSSGTAAFLAANGDARRFFVYDPRIGATLGAGSCPQGNGAFLNVERVPGLKGVLIRLTCMQMSSFQAQTSYFEHLPGSREVRAIKTVVRPDLQSSRLYFDERGWEVWAVFNQQFHQGIWRSSPGKKALRLWPPLAH